MKLSIVGTPIGNLGDFSPRALKCLQECDFIAAEDTRVTSKLLHHFDVHRPVLSYHAHNFRQRGPEILQRILAGAHCALVTDAGMPCISDPGEDLVRDCHLSKIPIEVIPGPVAFATALALSGFPSGRFTFEGFLSVNRKSRRAHLASLRGETRTMLFYEAPHKLAATCRDFSDFFGDRPLAIVRELTKIHEEVVHTNCVEASSRYLDESIKGELVLVLAGAKISPETEVFDEAAALELMRQRMGEGMTPAQAARCVAEETGSRRNFLYQEIIKEINNKKEKF